MFLFIAFSDIFYLCLSYRPVDRELSRNFLVDPSRRQAGNPWLARIVWLHRNIQAMALYSFQKSTISFGGSTPDMLELPYMLYTQAT